MNKRADNEWGGEQVPFDPLPLERASSSRHARQRQFRLLSVSDVVKQRPLDYRIKNVLPSVGIAAIYGPSASGKSFLILDAIMCIALGRPWFGHPTHACPVVYVAVEGGGGLAQRVQAFCAACERVQNAFFVTDPCSLRENGDVEGLISSIAAIHPGVVVIDTLNAAAPGADENSCADMGVIIESAKRIQVAVGGLVILVHHTGKNAGKGLRGHSSLFAALDAAIEVRRDGDLRIWSVAKSKDGADGQEHSFRLAVVRLGIDDDGEEYTSCTVGAKEVVLGRSKRPPRQQGKNQAVALEVIKDMLRTAATQPLEGVSANVPRDKPVVRFDDAAEKVQGKLVVEQRRRKERATQAIEGLVNGHLLNFEDGFLWSN